MDGALIAAGAARDGSALRARAILDAMNDEVIALVISDSPLVGEPGSGRGGRPSALQTEQAAGIDRLAGVLGGVVDDGGQP